LGLEFLLRAEQDDLLLNLDKVRGDASNLGIFKVIGVIQRDLSISLLDRFVMVARLRNLLDVRTTTEGIPIHILGSLDPVLTPLYFMAGAEIFDGLGWLQFGYVDGMAIRPDQWSALRDGLLRGSQQKADSYRVAFNLDAVKKLKEKLKRWAKEP
jgi:hypothetical protein